ncbi:Vps53-like protein [Paraphysoderma sedebokerense]|nr:Vps53-like protein [Paraphysoderma sedebokerense]
MMTDSPMKLTADVDEAISTVLKTKDPLDTSDFDSIDYINQIFPNEHSLSNVDKVLARLQRKISILDKEIKDLVRAQTDIGQSSAAELQATKQAIQDLFEQIKDIKGKCVESERIVQDITRDIKSLDYAKKHLTLSITVLKRLQMLSSAVEQLKMMAQRKQYKDVASLHQAVLQLMSHFKTYRSIPQISNLMDRLHMIQSDLRRQIFDLFDCSFTNQGMITGNIQQLAEGCLVVDTLDQSAKDQLMNWYIDLILREYRNIFRGNEELASLDNVPRRYAWLKRVMKVYDEEHTTVFPPTWNVDRLLCEKFCDDTKRGLTDVLNRSQTMDIKNLLKIMRTTIEFENQLSQRYSNNTPASTLENSQNALPESKYAGAISSCFEPYLSHFIEAEDKNLATMMESFRSKPPLSEEDTYMAVLQSSTELFLYYKEQLVQFSKLSTKKPFYDLAMMFDKWLVGYADVLQGKIPKDEKKPLSKDDWKVTCILLNTADYCSNITSQLEEKLLEKIHSDFKDKVQLSKARDAFMGVILSCIRTLIRGIEINCDPALTVMSKIPWGTLQSVGDQSEYITMIGSVLNECIPIMKDGLGNVKYFKMFCDKFADSFPTRFHNNLSKCRPISEVGAEQLLLDTHAVKTILLNMPNIGSDEPSAPPSTYAKIITKHLSKTEMMLKVILAPHDPPEGLVDNYAMLFPEKKLGTFQKILDLKGLRKSEMQAIIDIFLQKYPSSNETSVPPPPPSSSFASAFTSFSSSSSSGNSSSSEQKSSFMTIPSMTMPSISIGGGTSGSSGTGNTAGGAGNQGQNQGGSGGKDSKKFGFGFGLGGMSMGMSKGGGK